ncbi:glycoside hydrolase superfamily [Aspergillus filifer]
MAEFAQQVLSSGWTFKDSEDPSPDAWLPVPTVPSVVQQDLHANGKLEDPFIGFNELSARWVNEKSWTYRTSFLKPEAPAGSSIYLVFDGLDTFATVKLDGQIILQCDNMFLAQRVDVTKYLEVDGQHTLEIDFDCALLRARELRKQYPDHKWVGFNGDPARLSVRKAQYHWGWDWGPVLMTAGIWREVRLEVYSARVADIWTEVDLAEDQSKARISAFAEVDASSSEDSYKVAITLSFQGQEIAKEVATVVKNAAQITFEVQNPSLWWPKGYGDQALYEISVSLEKEEQQLHQVSKRFGIRTAEVIQQPDKHGKSFYFRINGVDVFCGGACWIPADSLLTNIKPDRYRKWIELMAIGHQVMVRVWGGGIYEDESFYQACDEVGVMVWQDFMFGCGNYPTWPELLESIEKEAEYNLRRLRHHPSIVIWVGNNEDYQVQEQQGLTYNYEDKDPESWLKTDFPARYIYEHLLPNAVKKISQSTFYHPGSPWGDGKTTSDPTVGDMHQWNVWHGTQEKYQIFDTLGGRFNSEFGMEAFPHMATIEHFVENEEDKYPQSHVLDFHNKADGHERRIATYLVENLRTATDLETHIYNTQVIQSETMMFGYRGWRRQWGDARQCGGALLWQINDCWPTISWAIVDYFLRPKPAFYAVRRVLQPIAIGVRRDHHDWSVSHAQPPKQSKWELWVVSSLLQEKKGRVELRFVSISTGKEIAERIIREEVTITPNGTTNVLKGIIDHTTTEPHVLAARVWVDDELVARDTDWPQPFKYLDLSDRGLEVMRILKTDDEQKFELSARKPVKCLVFEEREGVRVSDSAIDLVPGDDQVVTIRGLKSGDGMLKYKFLGQES